jgi:hypothetical protein
MTIGLEFDWILFNSLQRFESHVIELDFDKGFLLFHKLGTWGRCQAAKKSSYCICNKLGTVFAANSIEESREDTGAYPTYTSGRKKIDGRKN